MSVIGDLTANDSLAVSRRLKRTEY